MEINEKQYRKDQRRNLLRFGANAKCVAGFGYLNSKGVLDPNFPVELYITCRMSHIFSIAAILDEFEDPTAQQLLSLASHGIQALLTGPLYDHEHDGWFAASNDPTKAAYAHAFVMLAAASAKSAGIAAGDELLQRAIAVQNKYFWDESVGMVREQYNADWTQLDEYRGINSNMHTVEAYLASCDATGDEIWMQRAARIGQKVIQWAHDNNWRIPEHFTSDWRPVLDYNIDQPNHPFRPYGATVGHGLEWSRLLASMTLGNSDIVHHDFLNAARLLASRAISDGWDQEGKSGFVYTTDWDGKPIARARMHWVLAEAIDTATVLGGLTDDAWWLAQQYKYWHFAAEYLIDHEYGSWHHELDENNRVASFTWPGKPDIYHAYQACLIQDVPISTSFARSALLAKAK